MCVFDARLEQISWRSVAIVTAVLSILIFVGKQRCCASGSVGSYFIESARGVLKRPVISSGMAQPEQTL